MRLRENSDRKRNACLVSAESCSQKRGVLRESRCFQPSPIRRKRIKHPPRCLIHVVSPISNAFSDDYWFGFGIGPRSCPAVRWAFVSIKIFVAYILKTYEVLPGENTPELNDVKVRLAGPKIETTVPMKIRFRKR